ncbi:YdjY domain-containing protein [Pseudobythopirellula maris]|uniref:YdjY domain-containing protein n=1 Tax=Pseudobythopirellula maris TaxID=2527991 RepID=UPI0011B617D9|nr:YdjY domain-containing protein [Pseudobythopirellula maris]
MSPLPGSLPEPAPSASEPAVFKPLDPPPGARRLAPNDEVWVDAARSTVYVGGVVCLREGFLEMFACPRESKEHESVVAVNSPAFLIHTALLAVGAEPGSPVRFQPKYVPPKGDEILVRVEWRGPNGEIERTTAQQWVRGVKDRQPMKLPFVFAGSGFWTDEDTGKQHYLAESGDMICVSNFGTAMLDVPVESTQANEGLLFEAATEKIPPLGTPVRLVLTPKKAAEKPPAAAAESALESAR